MAQNDNMDWFCLRLMKLMRKEHRGHKAEIGANELTGFVKRVAKAYNKSDSLLLDALLRRNWLEPIGSNTYHIRYDMVDGL